MTDVSALAAGSSGAGTSGSKSADLSNEIGKTEFLTLLVAQLQNQDPLNPQDPTEFTAQLAQYSSLEQQFATNAHLAKMSESSADVQRLTALSLIGKEVVAESANLTLAPSPDAELNDRLGFPAGVLDGQLGYRLESAATEVELNIFNDQNVLVATVKTPPAAAGDHFVAWDGKGFSGNLLPAGNYTVEVTAKNAGAADEEASKINASGLIRGTVTGVEIGADGNELMTSAGAVSQAAISNVNQMIF
ncbi:MAG: flagellar hook assembly protein FlgD [Trichloromonas sp.]|nr:flagellar hook assembly protein FlgD [Trichloromonas sp.]